MAEDGYKIADGYVEIHTKADPKEIATSVEEAAHKAEPKVEAAGEKSIGRPMGKGASRGLSAEMKKTFGRIGRDSFDDVLTGFLGGSEAKSGGAKMRHAGNEAGGMFSGGFKDAWDKLGAKLTVESKKTGSTSGMSGGKSFFTSFIKTISLGFAGRGSIGSAFKSSPMMSTAGIGIGAALGGYIVSTASATITAGLGAALGGAFIAIGAFALRKNKQVVKAFQRTKSTLDKMLTAAAQPLAGPIAEGLDLITKRTKILGPLLKQTFGGIAPTVKYLAMGISRFFENMLRGVNSVMPGIQSTFTAFSMGLGTWGDALGDAFRSIFSDSQLVGRTTTLIMNGIGNLIRFLGQAIHVGTVFFGAYANGWIMVRQAIANGVAGTGALGRLTAAFGPLKTAVTGVWKAFQQFAAAGTDTTRAAAFQNLVAKIKAAWNPLKTFIKAVWAEAWRGVKAVWNSTVVPWWEGTAKPWLISKLKAGMNQAWEAAKQAALTKIRSIPGALLGAIKSGFSGVGGWLTGIGRDLVNGLWNGIKGVWASMTGWISSMVDKIPAIFRGQWQIHSPSKVTKKIAENFMQGFLDGFTTGQVKIDKMLEKFAKKVRGMDVSPKKFDQLKAISSKYTQAIMVQSKQLDVVRTKLEAAKNNYTQLKQAAADYYKQIKANTIGDVTQLGKGEDGSVTGAGIISDLTKSVQNNQELLDSLQKLKSMGLNKTFMQQILDQGVQGGGLDTARAILADPSQIAVVNALKGQLASIGTQLGNFGKSTFLQAGIDAALGLVKGLQSQEKALVAAMDKLAAKLVAALKKSLKIKSPSRLVEEEVGMPTGEAVGTGALKAYPAVRASMGQLVDRMLPSTSGPAAYQTPSSPPVATGTVSSGGIVIQNLNVTVKGILNPGDPTSYRAMVLDLRKAISDVDRERGVSR